MNYSESIEDDVLTVELQISDEEYLLWQLPLIEKSAADVYFEFNTQLSGGYNNVKEICLMRDGVHVVMANNRLEHFYFDKQFDGFTRLVAGLEKIYRNNRLVLEVLDY